MADNLSITPGAGALIRTNQGSSSGAHIQIVKLGVSAAGDETFLPATAANGLAVDVTRLQGIVNVNNNVAANLKVDASGATVPVSSPSPLNVAAGQGAPVFVRISDGTNPVPTLPVSIAAAVAITGNVGITGNPGVSQSGVWNIGTVTTITNPVTVTGTVGISGTVPVSGTITGNQGTPNTAANGWPTKISDGTNIAGPHTLVGGAYALKVDVVKQTGGGYSQQDKTAFTEGTTFTEVIGGVFNDAPASDPAANQASAARITPKRALHVNIRKQDGTELGIAATPVRTDPTGTTTQPVSGTVTANQGGAPWSGNTTQVNGHAVTEAANGTQKVGISDGSGANFTQANPLQVQNAPSTSGVWKAAVTFTASQSDIAIRTPGGGKTAYVEGLIITPTAAGAIIKIYDDSNAAANMIYQGQPPLGSIVITPSRPIPLSAINRVLRYATGASAAGDITAWGFEI